MDVLSKYKIYLYSEKEYLKVDKFITLGLAENGYFFKNPLNINNDFGYADLLEVDVRTYRKFIFCNVQYFMNEKQTTYLFKNEKEARRKKKLLIILLLEKYNTLNNISRKMSNLLIEKK